MYMVDQGGNGQDILAPLPGVPGVEEDAGDVVDEEEEEDEEDRGEQGARRWAAPAQLGFNVSWRHVSGVGSWNLGLEGERKKKTTEKQTNKKSYEQQKTTPEPWPCTRAWSFKSRQFQPTINTLVVTLRGSQKLKKKNQGRRPNERKKAKDFEHALGQKVAPGFVALVPLQCFVCKHFVQQR